MKKIIYSFQLLKEVVTPLDKKANFIVISATVLLLLGTIATTVALQNNSYNSVQAAVINSVEPEEGTITGNVTIENDANASGGKYITFGTLQSTPTPTLITENRDKFLWPFSSTSIWNMPIGSGAQFVDPMFQTPSDGYGVDEEVINLDPNGPLQYIALHSWPASCPGLGTWDDTPQMTSTRVHITDSYVTSTLDGIYPNMAGGLLDVNGKIQEVNYATRCTAGGALYVGSTSEAIRGTLDLYGDGLEAERGISAWGGHGGSMLSGVGGSIRKGELLSAQPIRHAIKFNIDMGFYGKRSGVENAHVWPAFVADDSSSQTYGACSDGVSGNEIIAMGALLAIPSTTDINTLGLESNPAKKLAWTLQNYGGYVVDNDGGGNCNWWHRGIMPEYGVIQEMEAVGISMTGPGVWQRDMDKLFKALRIVINNNSTSIGGGGTPLQPLAPPISN